MKTTLFGIGALMIGLGAAGCTADDLDDSDQIASEIEKEYGGLDMEDEAPMFGMEEDFEAADLAEEVLYDDSAIEGSEAVISMMSVPDAVVFNAAVLWGQIPGDPTNTQPRNWSGTMSVNRGALILRRTIRFEGPTDNVVGRTDPQTIVFTSATYPHHDGMRLTIIDPTPEDPEPLVLTLATANGPDFSATLGSLLDGPQTTVVDDDGNRIVGVAMAQPIDVCNHGFLAGRWHKVADQRGRLLSRVLDSEGEVVGHLRGVYGRRANGDKVFFGKYINTDGQFRGIFAGQYDSGSFVGRWLHRSGDKGLLGGEYRETIPGPETGGHMLGRWAETTCNLSL